MTRATPAHARTTRGSGALRVVALALVGFLSFGASVAYGLQWRTEALVDKVDTSALVKEPEIPKDARAGKSLNLLVMGVDDRSGENGELTDNATDSIRSDTTLLVHLSSDRTRAEVVSIPRDSMLPLPECLTSKGTTVPAVSKGMFNSAFKNGYDYGGDIESGTACTINAVQENTGLTIDHTILVDFSGFVGIVDSLGGIDMCIPEDVYSKKAGKLDLKAGQQVLDGKTALKLIRARTGNGWGLELGSDLARIERQQAILAATIQTAMSKNILTDLPKLTSFVASGLKSLTMDPELAGNMLGLATSMTSLRPSNVTFIKVPVADDPANSNHVIWTQEADSIWENMAIDEPALGTSDADASKDPSASTSASSSSASSTTTEKPTTEQSQDPTSEDSEGPSTDGSRNENSLFNLKNGICG